MTAACEHRSGNANLKEHPSGPARFLVKRKIPSVLREPAPGEVAEFQGLYGAFEFPERLFQKIWNLGFFSRQGLRTTDGREVEVAVTGEWNHFGGPDFRSALVRIGGLESRGDVELHLRPGDWSRHGHHQNPEFDGVILHVALFAPEPGEAIARTSAGVEIPLLVLLPHLSCSIEEFALEDALENVTGAQTRREVDEFFRSRPTPATLERLTKLSRKRWTQKVGFARIRVEKLGWHGACHHTALEILGYRHNRAPMLAIAEAFPLDAWKGGEPAAERLWECGGARWRVVGTRPANNPLLRLAQYSAWAGAVPNWPARLESIASILPAVEAVDPLQSIPELRKRGDFPRLRRKLATEVAGGAISGSRLDTLITNGFLPLVAAGNPRLVDQLFPIWCSWFAGDAPDWLKAVVRDATAIAGRRLPLCEGLLQGSLQLALEQTATGT